MDPVSGYMRRYVEGRGRDKIVLEIGAGCESILAHREHPYRHLLLSDINRDNLPAWQSRQHPRTSYMLADFCHLPFRSGSVDVVVAKLSLHHSPDLAQTLREAFRCLKPGGEFIALEPCNGRFIPRSLTLRNMNDSPFENENTYPIGRWQQFFKRAEFADWQAINTFTIWIDHLVHAGQSDDYRRQLPAPARMLLDRYADKLPQLSGAASRLLCAWMHWLGYPPVIPHFFSRSIFGGEYYEVFITARKPGTASQNGLAGQLTGELELCRPL